MVPAADKPAKLPQHHVDATPAGSVVVIACPPGRRPILAPRALHLSWTLV